MHLKVTQIATFMGLARGPPGSCRPQMSPMLTPWTLLSGKVCKIGDILFMLQCIKCHCLYQDDNGISVYSVFQFKLREFGLYWKIESCHNGNFAMTTNLACWPLLASSAYQSMSQYVNIYIYVCVSLHRKSKCNNSFYIHGFILKSAFRLSVIFFINHRFDGLVYVFDLFR